MISVFKNNSCENDDNFKKLADLLSDNDEAVVSAVNDFSRDKSEFSKKYSALIDELDISVAHITLEEIVKCSLSYFGYMGINDWKFSLEDFLFNSEKAFQHYNISMDVYSSIANQDEIVAPEAFNIIAKNLPIGFSLGLWDEGSDSYLLIIAPTSILEKAIKIVDEINKECMSLEIYQIDSN